MGKLTVLSPVPVSRAMDFAGPRPMQRKALAWGVRHGGSILILWDGQPAVLVQTHRAGWRRVELAMAFSRHAKPAMGALIRLMQLTGRRMRQDGYRVEITIRHAGSAGLRMARLAGFMPDGNGRHIWTENM